MITFCLSNIATSEQIHLKFQSKVGHDLWHPNADPNFLDFLAEKFLDYYKKMCNRRMGPPDFSNEKNVRKLLLEIVRIMK